MSISRIVLCICSFFISSVLSSQDVNVVSLRDNGSYIVEKLRVNPLGNFHDRSGFKLLDGFPVVQKAHPSFKNFRNVSLADTNNDGHQEILVCMNETLYCIDYQGAIMWQSELVGTSNFPPAISDLDNDGFVEIAVQTYTVPQDGRVYLFDHLGNVQSGWPVSMNNHFFLNAVTFADMNQDGMEEIIACERVSTTEGHVHVLDMEASSIGAQRPITLNGTPAFTPSVADLNQDQSMALITSSTSELYIFNENGDILPDYPISEEGKRFSYQSPLIFNNSKSDEYVIVGARHGDNPDYYMLNQSAEYEPGWPIADQNWNYATPAVADIDVDGDMELFYGRPFVSETTEGDILLGFDEEGNTLEGFPITGFAGSEGLITIADVNNDGEMDLLTSSKIIVGEEGFIHAYKISTGEELEGFPIRVPGYTFLNGAYLGDVNGDEFLDLTALSYQLKFDNASPDSAYVSVFDLQVPYDKNKILFNGYKGANHHRGSIVELISNTNPIESKKSDRFLLKQNLVRDILEVQVNDNFKLDGIAFRIINTNSQVVKSGLLESEFISIRSLNSGQYYIIFNDLGRFSTLPFQKY